MYRVQIRPEKAALAGVPIEMPVDILLALPGYIRHPSHSPFNLIAALGDLLAGSGWEHALKVLRPRIWAPGWSDRELSVFFTSELRDTRRLPAHLPLESFRAAELPGHGVFATPERPASSQHEIIHFLGLVEKRLGEVPRLYLGGGDPESLGPRELLAILMAARTRLLILQVTPSSPMHFAAAEELAEAVVGGGGPAVLVVTNEAPWLLDPYFRNLYAEIVHNRPLSEAAAHPLPPSVEAVLVLGEGGEELLRFDRWMDQLEERVDRLQRARGLDLAMEGIAKKASRVYQDLTSLRTAEPWRHETEGAIPLTRSAEAIAELEREHLQTASRQEERAPRVLNASFFGPAEDKAVGLHQGLVTGREYELRVDVGPRWKESLVVGKAVFPEQALPPDTDGYMVQVVLISDDFTPGFATRRMWVPKGSGRSSPCEGDSHDSEPGPVVFRLKSPSIGNEDGPVRRARARLSLYFENNLLQSGVVDVGVVRDADLPLADDNVVQIDFALTAGFHEVRERFAKRHVRLVGEREAADHPVTVNLTLNDDGAGGHRIVVQYRDGRAPELSPVGWTPVDPLALRDILEDARGSLLACFYKKDERSGVVVKGGDGKPALGLDEDNGQRRDQFLWDLMRLATLGNRLYHQAFGQVRPGDSGQSAVDWVRQMRRTLARSAIVQVARTAPAQYVFPWALVYEYPLPGPRPRISICRVLREWSEAGRRDLPPEKACPYQDEPWHRENIVCPYGFWGLKHVVEQPPSPLRRQGDGAWRVAGAVDKVYTGSHPGLNVGVTDALDTDFRDRHLARLVASRALRFVPADPANDLAKVRAMLQDAEIVYFLCHGEFDRARNQPYLGVGLRDQDEAHRVYASQLRDWAVTEELPNLATWSGRRPMVLINGCHTADLVPGQLLDFVSAFAFAGASGVIGTEVSVLLPVAAEAGESLLGKIARSVPVGQAIQEMRWELANKGNLIGLAYTPYCLANLQVLQEPQGPVRTETDTAINA